MKALLIIDMQRICFKTPRYNSDQVTERIKLLANAFRQNGDLVIFIQHNGTKENYCLPGTKEWEIIPELEIKPDDVVVHKTANDAFYRSELKSVLAKHGIEELVITGCASDFCVDATIKSALVNDYKLTVIADAHTTADKPGISAKQLIDHHNWLWTEMAPTKYGIAVKSTRQFLDA